MTEDTGWDVPDSAPRRLKRTNYGEIAYLKLVIDECLEKVTHEQARGSIENAKAAINYAMYLTREDPR